jgi:hypothetical protein
MASSSSCPNPNPNPDPNRNVEPSRFNSQALEILGAVAAGQTDAGTLVYLNNILTVITSLNQKMDERLAATARREMRLIRLRACVKRDPNPNPNPNPT